MPFPFDSVPLLLQKFVARYAQVVAVFGDRAVKPQDEFRTFPRQTIAQRAFEGFADLSFGSYDSNADALSRRVEAAVGGPFSDRVAGRISGMYKQNDAYLNNLYPLRAPVGLAGGPPGPGAR